MKKINVLLGVIVTLMCEISILSVNFVPKPLSKENNILALEKVIYSKEITVEDFINKFNEVLLQNNLDSVDLEYLTVIDGTYYVGLFQDIILFITPNTYNEISSDIVYQNGIIVLEDTNNFDLACLYYKYLIEANNEFIFNANELVNCAIEGEIVDQNNGLVLTLINDNYEINLFIERKYNS